MVSISPEDTRNALIPLREGLCLISLFIISEKISRSHINLQYIGRAIIILLSIMLLVVLIQFYFISTGNYLSFPPEYYIMNRSTIEGAELALEFGTRFRPTGFYGEPSYAAWIVLSLMVLALKIKPASRGYVITISLFSVIALQSLSGVISILLYVLIWWSFNSKQRSFNMFKLIGGILLLSIIAFTIASFSDEFYSRVQNIITNRDVSTSIRLFEPMTYFNQLISDNLIFGLNNFGEIKIDNAAWSLILHYGILSVPIILSVILKLRSVLLIVYLLLCFNFNGSIFIFDKVLILAFVFGVFLNVEREFIPTK